MLFEVLEVVHLLRHLKELLERHMPYDRANRLIYVVLGLLLVLGISSQRNAPSLQVHGVLQM